eukprot:scaffold34262_cov81-Phaeocystis_antarctica.AAC.2
MPPAGCAGVAHHRRRSSAGTPRCAQRAPSHARPTPCHAEARRRTPHPWPAPSRTQTGRQAAAQWPRPRRGLTDRAGR